LKLILTNITTVICYDTQELRKESQNTDAVKNKQSKRSTAYIPGPASLKSIMR